MPYDTQGIQQQGRLFEVGEETGSGEKERGQGSKRKTKSEDEKRRGLERKKELRKLRKDGLAPPEAIRRDPPWLECSKCFAKIGIGCRTTAMMIGVHPTTVTKAWMKRGIIADRPKCGSMVTLGRSITLKNNPRRPTEAESKAAYHYEWMKEVMSHDDFPDWSSVWKVEKNRVKAMEKYNALTDEEKKERGKQCLANRKKRHETHPETKARDRARIDKWKKDNPKKSRESQRKSVKKRLRNDPSYRAIFNMRDRFKDVMAITKHGGNKHFTGLIGCTTQELKRHIESKFKRWMTWENYGTRWHVDHIIPVASFDHSSEAQRRLCWHFTNLRPLCARANLAKKDTITEPQMHLFI